MRIKKTLSQFLIISIILLSSCATFFSGDETNQKLAFAETVFQVRLVQPLVSEEKIYLEIIDEVTGIALNPTRFKMEALGSAEYTLRIPLAIGSVVRYRYIKDGSSNSIEKNPQGNQVNYRLHQITGPAQINDLVIGWDAVTYTGETGEISGFIFDKSTEVPLGEILVTINGMQTYTSFDGFYKFENVPLGEYTFLALHLNGLYKPFQQNAIIAQNSVTPASFGMEPSKLVEIAFSVIVPEDTDSNAVIKLLGNTYSLGNSFSELSGGSSTLASRAPVLEKVNEGAYSVKLKLPAGLDLRYKYTLGDGFINSEHNEDSSFRTRQLIVPEQNTTINDHVSTWFSNGSAPVKFSILSPGSSDSNDLISIQFNPFVWMQPVSMWNNGNNEWSYSLYSPLEFLNQSQYRFCRNDQCGIADDSITHGKNATGYLLDLDNGTPLTISYQVAQWYGTGDLNYAIEPTTFPATSSILVKGFEFTKPYDQKWFPFIDSGLINIGVSGGNWIFFSPTWTFNAKGISDLNPSKDVVSKEIISLLKLSNEAGLNFSIYPQMGSSGFIDNYWATAELSYNWWQRWFENYQRFILNYVDFSAQNGINTMIIGGNSVSPAFPNGKLPNGVLSNTPYDFADKWTNLINLIRARFPGQLGFALPYSSNLDQAPGFISSVDFIYLEMDSALTDSSSPSVGELEIRFENILDTEAYKLYATYQKPVVLGIDYFAIDGTASNCLNSSIHCEDLYNSSQRDSLAVDTNEQADVYQGIMKAAIARPWIYGIVSKGYNPAVGVQDASNSVHGKPAMQVISYYFNNLN